VEYCKEMSEGFSDPTVSTDPSDPSTTITTTTTVSECKSSSYSVDENGNKIEDSEGISGGDMSYAFS